jgi:hypothetical protein
VFTSVFPHLYNLSKSVYPIIFLCDDMTSRVLRPHPLLGIPRRGITIGKFGSIDLTTLNLLNNLVC